MKKFLKISGISILCIFLLLLLLPFLFQGKIIEIVKKEANEMLNAKVDFGKISLSFIRNFPNATIVVNDFSAVGVGEFENDTLAMFDKLLITVNIKSFFTDKYEVNRIALNNPKVYAKVLADGKANWDIVKDSGNEEKPEEKDSTKTSSFNLSLDDLSIKNGYIVYEDLEGNMKAVLDNLNFNLSGDMSADITTLKIKSSIEKLAFYMDNIAYLNNAAVNAKMDIAADLKNMKFTLSDNELSLNRIKMNLDGWLAVLDNGYDMDIKLNTPNIEFKDLLSLIPAVYAKDFEKIKTDGEVQLSADAKGIYAGDVYPAFNVKLNVSNAYFQYPDLPKSIDNININAAVTNPGGSLDLTVIDISKFHFEMAQNPFDVIAKISSPMSDLAFNFEAKGTLNLDMVKEVYPLDEGMDISGTVKADLEAAGKMSQIEKEQYESMTAKGILEISNFVYKSKDMQDMLIDAGLNFTPKFVELTNLSLKMGNNDIQAKGRLENFIPYVLKNETIKGELTVNSTLLNVNDFMGGENTGETEQTAAASEGDSLTVIEIPKNIDFRLNAALKKVTYDKMILENINGIITAANGKLNIENANMNAFGGQMNAKGYYNTADIKNPDVDLNLNIKDVKYSEIFNQLDLVQQFAPIFENMNGNLSTDLSFHSKLNPDMSLNYPSVNGKGVLTSRNVSISNVEVLNKLADVLKNESLRKISLDNIKVNFTIEQGRLHTEPFDVNFGNNIKMNISGSTGLDQTIDYTGKVTTPQQIGGIPVTMNLKIGGTFKSPSVKLDASDMLNAVKDKAVTEAKAVVNENLGKLVDEARKQKDNLVAEAEKQAANIRSTAQQAGDKLIAEANTQGQNLIAEANKTSNAIAKIAAVKAAEASAKKLNEEAQKQANNLKSAADNQANNLVNTAKTQGDKLIQEAEAKAKI
jgi:hypothetical protein